MTKTKISPATLEWIDQNPDQARVLLKLNLRDYIAIFHYYLTRENFDFQPFHLEIIRALENIVYDEPRNLVLNMPVRWGKSTICQMFLSWTYALNRNCNTIYSSYSDTLVKKFSSQVRDLIASPLYQKLFKISLDQSSQDKSLWKISGGGEMRAASMGAGLTGFGCGGVGDSYSGCLIIDDPLKPSDARSDVMKRACLDYFDGTLKTRRNNPKTPIIIIAQRLAPDDLCGYLKDNFPGDYRFLEFKALDERDESIWPGRYPSPVLRKLREENPGVFSAQYMQSPTIEGGNIIKPEVFKRYRGVPDDIIYTKLFADTAMMAKESSDNSAFLLAGYTKDKRIYILDVVAKKLEFPALISEARFLYTKYRSPDQKFPAPRSFCIEQKSSGISLIQMLQKDRIVIEPLKPVCTGSDGKPFTADKVQRLYEVLPLMDQVYVPEAAPWLNDFLKELAEFSADFSHAHDDRTDCFIYALREVFKPKVHSKF